MSKKYKGFKGSGMRKTSIPKYELEKLSQQVVSKFFSKLYSGSGISKKY